MIPNDQELSPWTRLIFIRINYVALPTPRAPELPP
ncbi:hypothetical protein CCP2SC5_2540001 [Azospirillaceae bacterium]